MSKKLINCKACGQEIAKSAKSCPMCGAKNKKPIFKKWWFWLIVAIFIISVASGGSDTETEPDNTTQPTTQAPTTVATDPSTTEPKATVSIELIAGEAGEYGELFTINKDTEFEETYYIYHIPAGTYTVTNTGEYMSQFNVYSDEIVVNDSGWEEVAESFYVEVLEVGDSDTFTIEDGQFIEIHEPAKFTLEKIEGNKAESAVAEETTAKETEATESTEELSMTMGEKNALASAKSYLAFSAFSYNGLIDQLEFEGYTTEEATFAADNCGADWNEQALESALSYLRFTAFSYEGLIEQLEFEKFTSEQATYGADNCGADWNEQAAKSAESYLDFTSFSREGLIEQLEYEGFTHEQAVYGVEANGY